VSGWKNDVASTPNRDVLPVYTLATELLGIEVEPTYYRGVFTVVSVPSRLMVYVTR
jgi:hypothetical protein